MARRLTISVGQHSDKGRKQTNQDFHGALIPDEPLHTFPKQADKDCIDNLVKTFGKFEAIR